MSITIINPKNNYSLSIDGDSLVDIEGNSFPIIDGIPRIADLDNYTENFGFQWNKFPLTQLDRENEGLSISRSRFFAETCWNNEDLSDKNILEVGSGAGRFSKVVLENTKATLYSVDFSDAVNANKKSNGHIAPDRFYLYQASIYEMPFLDNSFDKVFCFGVLQHTPDFDASVKALINKAMPGGEIVVDFYPIKGWWTKINAKYLIRPLTKKMPHEKLLNLIENNIDFLIKLHFTLHSIGLGILARFIPVCNIKESFPENLTPEEMREWAILDTFDQYSPEHDHPQRISKVVKMFEKYGARVSFAGNVQYGLVGPSCVIRAIKI